MDAMLNLLLSRPVAAILAAKCEPAQMKGGKWFIGERAGDRYAVDRIITPGQRNALLVSLSCLREDRNEITAAELADLFGTDRPMQQFINDLEKLAEMKVAPVIVGKRGKPHLEGRSFHIFKNISRSCKRPSWKFASVSWEWTKEYNKEVKKATDRDGNPVKPQLIRYPKIGLKLSPKKFPMASMVMLAFADQFTRCNDQTNAFILRVENAFAFWPVELKRSVRWWRVFREPLNKILEQVGLKKAPEKWHTFIKHKIDFQMLFPKRKPRKRKQKNQAGFATQNNNPGANCKNPGVFCKNPGFFAPPETRPETIKQGVSSKGENPSSFLSLTMQARRAVGTAAARKVKNQ